MNAQSAAPVFHVSNLDAALKHYTEVLGFALDFRFDDYAGVKLGDVTLHLSARNDYLRPIGGGTVYVFCDEVDGYYATLQKQGAALKSAPANAAYGMRDFVVADVDGNQLSFGQDLEKR